MTVRVRLSGTLNPSQARFVQSDALWTAFLGGWGAGKTWIGARKFLEIVLRNPPGTDGLLFAPFWSTLHRSTLRLFLDATPPQLVRGHSKKERYVELLGRRRVYYGSADRPETLDGSTVAAVWGDEVRYIRREAWKIAVSRLRDARATCARGIVTSTPTGSLLEEEFGTEKPDRIAVHASTRENTRNLLPGYVESLTSTLSAREARVFIEGEFGVLSGAVYAEFDRKHHLVDWKYDPRFRTIAAIDFGYRRPYVGFAQHLPAGWPIPGRGKAPPGGAYVLFDEIVVDDTPTPALAKLIVAKGYQLTVIYCDPAGDGVNVDTGLSSVKELQEHGLRQVPIRFVTDPRWRHVPTGVAFVRGLLRSAGGETRLWLARPLDKPRAVRGAVKDLEGYRYPEAKDGKPVGDQPVKDGVHDHGVDAVRYLAVNEILRGGQVLPASVPSM